VQYYQPVVERKTLRVVLAGYGRCGESFARRIAALPWCRLVAIADPDPAALERATSLYQVSTFTDLRKLLAATDADVVLDETMGWPAAEALLRRLSPPARGRARARASRGGR
jgi:prephenate dehydrogenase